MHVRAEENGRGRRIIAARDGAGARHQDVIADDRAGLARLRADEAALERAVAEARSAAAAAIDGARGEAAALAAQARAAAAGEVARCRAEEARELARQAEVALQELEREVEALRATAARRWEEAAALVLETVLGRGP